VSDRADETYFEQQRTSKSRLREMVDHAEREAARIPASEPANLATVAYLRAILWTLLERLKP